MYRIQTSAVAVVVVLCVPSVSLAQGFVRRSLDRFDANNDGKISRQEVPEGLYRRMFDRMIEQYKLDPEKTYTRAELEKVLGRGGSGSEQSGSLRRTGSSGRSGSQRQSIRRFRRNSSARAGGSSQRRYRSLVKLPEEFARYDEDGDGQVGLYEWPRDRIPEFLSLDKNDDGFLTIKELKPRKEEKPASDDDTDSL